jgi:hypothetical protein
MPILRLGCVGLGVTWSGMMVKWNEGVQEELLLLYHI